MKKLNLVQMEKMSGGRSSEAFMCGVGVSIAAFGFAFSGGISLIALSLCMTGDSRHLNLLS